MTLAPPSARSGTARGTTLGAPDLAALVAARICHDLVSPLGAIGNGLELLQMAGGAPAGPEVTLMSQSLAAANARMRLFRVAFGAHQPGASITRAEVGAILAGLAPGARALVNWQPPDDLPRDEVRLGFLLLMCLETTLPYGGGITIGRADGGWNIRAQAGRMAFDRALWDVAAGHAAADAIVPRHVHFALVPGALGALRRELALSHSDGAIDLRA